MATVAKFAEFSFKFLPNMKLADTKKQSWIVTSFNLGGGGSKSSYLSGKDKQEDSMYFSFKSASQ